MDVPWGLGLLLLLLGIPIAQAEPLYILVTPRVLRIGSPETIHVEAHSDSSEPLSHPLEVNLSVWDFPMKNTRVARRELVLSKENHFMDQASVTIPEDLVYPPKPGMQYVIIEANWAPTSVSSSMNKLVLVAPHAGYIFIQTDKTIYTPEQSVQYRVYTVNHRMDPVSRTFTLDIKNPEGIAVISKDLLPDNGVYIDSFTLPERISIGTWTIEASYQTAPKQKFKTGFEVKEYVLPSFEVQLTPNKTFFYLRDEVLGVNIQARYIFNKPVDGHALAIFGVKQDSRRIPIQSSLQRVEISQGHGHISLQKDTLMAAFQGSEEDFIGASIFVNVTVFSSGAILTWAPWLSSRPCVLFQPRHSTYVTSGQLLSREIGKLGGVKIVLPSYLAFTKWCLPYQQPCFFPKKLNICCRFHGPHVSPGGEMVQTEISGVKIVRSPYNIKFIKTPQYFKPGMPFSFRVFVSNPDGSPASKVLVSCTNVKVHTTPRGEATLVINTEANLKELTIQVKTEAPIQPEEQASASMTARPYSTQDESGNFLHIDVKALSTEVGSNLQLNLNTNRDSSVSNKITRFTILVLSKGQIVHAKELKNHGSVFASTIIDVTSKMLPSFRILAFYLLPKGTGQDPELVADSILIDVNDKCQEKLKIGLQNEAYVQPIQPSSLVALKVTGDAEATVGLAAVDKAVHILNSKHKFTQKKIWDTVEEHDIGCTAGSGKDRLAVFKDAGLDMKMSTGMDTLASTDWHCPPSPSPSHRRRRSLKRLETKRKAVNKFKTELEQKCCEAGLRENPVGLSCKERIQHVRHGPVCITAFLSCCQLSETLTREAREEQLLLGTTDEDDDLDDFFLEDEPVRSVFPESWFWKTITLPKTTQGNEQVQIQAVLYNFLQQSVKVRVEFPHKESLCSAAKPDAPSRQIVAVPPFSSKVVPFVLLPLEIGKVDVEVKARGSVVQDHVRKTLLVQAGGQIEQISQSFLLNPQGQTKTQLVPKQEFLNKIPNTEADVFVSVQGDILGETILGTLTPSETWRLLRIPSGCPEQTLSSLTPVVILTRYLDSTGQWNKVGVELREQVMKNLARGYSRMLTHRSEDGSYHTSKGNPGSTWLTSYVFRVYALAYPTMTISALSLDSVCNIANWIITHRQRTHGNFVEESPVVMWSMQGGYHGSEADISLTALVLIALNEGKELCSQKIPSLADSMKRAGDFLEKKLPHIRTTFAMAITSYALALIRSPRANDYLDSFASKNKTHWPVGLDDLDLDDSLYTIEATAYALMQKLELGRRNETHAIANWLLKKRQLGGGFQSTQTTVVAIEALTRFRKAVPFEGVQDLHIQIKSSKKALHVEWVIDEKNAYQLRSAKFSAEEELQIKASGTGRGTISILTVYHRSPEFLENTCKQYHLNVTLNENQKENKKGEATFQLRMETRFQGHRDATMTIMEISLLTGFYPNQDDLKQLTSEVERYAFQYETKMNSSDSTVVLYLEKLSHKEDTVLGFRVHRMLKAEFLQAAQVTVYDYYEPSRRCTSFYNLPTEHASLRKICDKDVCRCAEEQCPSPKKDSNHLSQEELQTAACEAGVDFVYKASLESVETSDSNPYIYYNMKLQAIIKSGTDSAKPLAVKKFVTHTTCQDSLGLQEHETYLIMGQISDLWRVKSEYIHVLGKETFLMHWPANGTVGKKELLDQLAGFSDYMHTHGCES
ncbi:complement C3-like isoform X2 [Bos indicus]|uniref:Complement C3-like isoform X2 n=1 Tax=Bos indicus TaxID=9915 RepID=A0ABM4SM61_BOSIN